MHFYQAICEGTTHLFVTGLKLGIDFEKKKITCVEKSSVYFSDHKDREHFELDYDLLVIGVGAKNNTFNVPGVDKYAFFLKVALLVVSSSSFSSASASILICIFPHSQELNDAREIRGRIIEIFEKASLPCRTIEEKRNLLHFIIVGAGPTGIEVCSHVR